MATDMDGNALFTQVMDAIEKNKGMLAEQQRRDTEAMVNAAVTKAVQREVASALQQMFSGQSNGAGGFDMGGMNDKSVSDALGSGSMTSSLLRAVYGLSPLLLSR